MWITNNTLIRAYNKDLIKGYKLIIPENLNFRKDSFQYCTNLRKLVIGNISLDVQVVDGVLFVHKNIKEHYMYEHIKRKIEYYGYDGYSLYKLYGEIRTSKLYLLEKDGRYIIDEFIIHGFYTLCGMECGLEPLCDKIHKTNSILLK